MFIGYPLRELLDIVLYPVMLGVEDVHAILGCSYSVFIKVVIAVTANMVPLVNNQTLSKIIIIQQQ